MNVVEPSKQELKVQFMQHLNTHVEAVTKKLTRTYMWEREEYAMVWNTYTVLLLIKYPFQRIHYWVRYEVTFYSIDLISITPEYSV